MRELLLLDLHGLSYGIWKEDILSVEMQIIHWLPGSAEKRSAVTVTNGHATTLVDLAAAIGMPPICRGQETTVLLLANQARIAGFMIEGEIGEASVETDTIYSLPNFLRTSLFDSCVYHNAELIPVINIKVLHKNIQATGYQPGTSGCYLPRTEPLDIVDLDSIRMFKAGGMTFCASAENFKDEVMTVGQISRMPLTPEYLAGFTLHQESVVPVIDLARKIHLPGDCQLNVILIAELDGQRIGFLVDSDDGELPRKDFQINRLPRLAQSEWLQSAAIWLDRIIPIIDLHLLLAAPADTIAEMQKSEFSGISTFQAQFGREEVEIVEFSLFGTIHALAGSEVGEPLPFTPFVPIPDAEILVAGVALFKGELMTVIDPARCFGGSSKPTPDWHYIPVRKNGFRALLISRFELPRRTLPVDMHRNLPFKSKNSVVYGCYPEDDGVRLILDIEALTIYFDEERNRELIAIFSKKGVGFEVPTEDEEHVEVDEAVESPEDKEQETEPVAAPVEQEPFTEPTDDVVVDEAVETTVPPAVEAGFNDQQSDTPAGSELPSEVESQEVAPTHEAESKEKEGQAVQSAEADRQQEELHSPDEMEDEPERQVLAFQKEDSTSVDQVMSLDEDDVQLTTASIEEVLETFESLVSDFESEQIPEMITEPATEEDEIKETIETEQASSETNSSGEGHTDNALMSETVQFEPELTFEEFSDDSDDMMAEFADSDIPLDEVEVDVLEDDLETIEQDNVAPGNQLEDIDQELSQLNFGETSWDGRTTELVQPNKSEQKHNSRRNIFLASAAVVALILIGLLYMTMNNEDQKLIQETKEGVPSPAANVAVKKATIIEPKGHVNTATIDQSADQQGSSSGAKSISDKTVTTDEHTQSATQQKTVPGQIPDKSGAALGAHKSPVERTTDKLDIPAPQNQPPTPSSAKRGVVVPRQEKAGRIEIKKAVKPNEDQEQAAKLVTIHKERTKVQTPIAALTNKNEQPARQNTETVHQSGSTPVVPKLTTQTFVDIDQNKRDAVMTKQALPSRITPENKVIPQRHPEPVTQQPAPHIPGSLFQWYTVRKGDTLWWISEHYTGKGINYHKLARDNKINNPDLIFPYQKVKVNRE